MRLGLALGGGGAKGLAHVLMQVAGAMPDYTLAGGLGFD